MRSSSYRRLPRVGVAGVPSGKIFYDRGVQLGKFDRFVKQRKPVLVGLPNALRRCVASDQDTGNRLAEGLAICATTWAPLQIPRSL
jgi:hypothetical protein